MISKNLVMLDYEQKDSMELIKDVAERMEEDGKLNNKEKYIQSVLEREQLSCTCFDFNVAIPHGKTDAVKEACFAFVRTKEPIDWINSTENKARLIFMIAVPESDQKDTHLKILSKLCRKIMHEEFREKLLTIQDVDETVNMLNEVVE